jgi:HlyD family secretion protein
MMRRSIWLGLSLLAIGAGSVSVWALQTVSEVHVTTAKVTEGRITRRVAATGSLQAVTTVEIGVQVSGIVQSLSADFNSFVRAGQVLARLDPSLYDAQLREAQAALAQAQAALGRAEADVLGLQTARQDAQTKLTRAEALARSQLITQSDLDAARIAMDEASADLNSGQAAVVEARASVAQAKAADDQAAVNLDHTIIRSPIDGIVVDRTVDIGQTLASSVQAPVLFRIAADLSRMQVQVNVDESDVGGMTAGDPASFQVESYPNETFNGTLSQVRLQPIAQLTTTATTLPTSTAAGTTSQIATVVSYTAIVDVPNVDQRLRPGMTAEVVLPGARRERAVRIPNSALSFRPPPDVLRALSATAAAGASSDVAKTATDQKSRQIWEYDGTQFHSIPVAVGLADDGWTELLGDAIHPGDALVTSAVLERRHRL